MVDLSEIKSYEAPGALLNKSRETIGSNSSAKMYDNVPKTPTKSNDSESYFHGDEEGVITDSDGKNDFQHIGSFTPVDFISHTYGGQCMFLSSL